MYNVRCPSSFSTVLSVAGELAETGGDVNAFRQLGFRSLDDFVRSHTDQFRIHGDIVFAHLKDESAHISSLVANQKQTKKKVRISRIMLRSLTQCVVLAYPIRCSLLKTKYILC